jgi:DNA-binding SARP family transcriptional activator/EAL domain-containing protein (putative c-di-GMP-specific phosphodiesterase class I)
MNAVSPPATATGAGGTIAAVAPTEPVQLLGTLAIGSLSASEVLRGRRSELAFALLAAEHERLVSRDELAEALWPAGLPPSWAPALRVVIAQVRQLLRRAGWAADACLVTTRSGYRLSLPEGVETDLDQLRRAVERSAERLAAGDPEQAVAAAEWVRSRAGLAFLPEHDGPWVDQHRRQLHRWLTQAWRLEAEGWAELGDRRRAGEAAAGLVGADPLDESAHRLRIRLLAGGGDASGAARAYEECVAILARELGVRPSPETEAARWAVPDQGAPASAGDVVPPVPAEGTAPAVPGAANHRRLGVLVVEDHDFQRRTLVQVLQAIGVGWVESVSDGADALERIRRGPHPDLVLCDIDLPRMDGVEFVRHLGAEGRCMAVAFTSALEPAMLRSVEALSAGYGLDVLGALPKPVTAKRLRQLLDGFAPRSGEDVAPERGRPARPEELRRALNAGEVTARFRPRLDLITGTLSAVTIKPAWERHAGGPVPAATVADLAGQGGFLHELGQEMLRRAARVLNHRSAAAVPRAVVVPLPRASVADVRLADHWAQRAESYHLEPGRLVASVDLRHQPGGAEVLDALTRLRLKGFGLSLHGYDASAAARQCVTRLPFSAVTLAPRLVSGASGDAQREERLEALVEEVTRLGLPVVADGCDHRDDFALLVGLGCPEAQGDYIGGALAAAELARWTPAGALTQPQA